MPLYHKFFLLKKDQVPKDFNGFKNLLKSSDIDFIEVDDAIINTSRIYADGKIIRNKPFFIKGFKAYNASGKALPRYGITGEIESIGEGLNLDGITVIPNTSVEPFLKNVTEAKNLEEATQEIKEELDALIALCRKALHEDLYVIHLGL